MPLRVEILTTSSCGTTHLDPVGRVVAGPGKTSGIDQGFQKCTALNHLDLACWAKYLQHFTDRFGDFRSPKATEIFGNALGEGQFID